MPEPEAAGAAPETQDGTDPAVNPLEAVPDEQLLLDPRVQRAIQSQKDKEIAAFRKAQQQAAAQASAAAKRQAEIAEINRLAAEGNHAAIGERAVAQIRQEESDAQVASRLTAEVVAMIRERPEFRTLGEDRIAQIQEEEAARGGDLASLAGRLAVELVVKAQAEAIEKAKAEQNEALEARLTELGLVKRAETPGAVGAVEQATRPSGAMTEDQILERYGDTGEGKKEAQEIMRKRGLKVLG